MRSSAFLILLAAVARAGGEAGPKLERTIPLEGVKGRIDHMALAPDGSCLAVAALGNDTVEIVDLKEGAAAHRITGVGQPTGVVWGDQLAVASGRAGKLIFFDSRTYRPVHEVLVGDDADNVRADETRQYVGVGEGALVAVDKGGKRFEVRLDGHPEGFQLDAKGGRILVNVPDAGHVAVVDPGTKKVVATWEVKDAAANYPMALDEEHGLVLIGCRQPPVLLVLDAKDGSVKAKVEISGDVDDLFLDPKTRRVYASCGEGSVDVIDAGKWERVAKVATSPGARTCLLDAKGGRLFVAAPAHDGKPASILVFRTAPGAPSD